MAEFVFQMERFPPRRGRPFIRGLQLKVCANRCEVGNALFNQAKIDCENLQLGLGLLNLSKKYVFKLQMVGVM
jgi:hypothetical protein